MKGTKEMVIKTIVFLIAMLVSAIVIGVVAAISSFTLDIINEKLASRRQARELRMQEAKVKSRRDTLWKTYIKLLLD
jgi:uncharacterized membrane protein (DUF106 family)